MSACVSDDCAENSAISLASAARSAGLIHGPTWVTTKILSRVASRLARLLQMKDQRLERKSRRLSAAARLFQIGADRRSRSEAPAAQNSRGIASIEQTPAESNDATGEPERSVSDILSVHRCSVVPSDVGHHAEFDGRHYMPNRHLVRGLRSNSAIPRRFANCKFQIVRIGCGRPRLLLLACIRRVQGPGPHAAAPIHYRFTFPEPQHHWMQVEATFPDLAARTPRARMSRASPGRYSLHDFAKNVLRRARVRRRRPRAADRRGRIRTAGTSATTAAA